VNSWFRSISHLSFGGWAVLLSLLLTGCGKNDVEVYRVAKEQAPATPPAQAQTQPAAMPPGHPDASGGSVPALKWKLPTGWEEVAPGEMRVASFHVRGEAGKQADVSVVPLPGMAGGDLNNVNRWRGQVGLAPVSEDELSKLAQAVEVGGQSAQLYDQAGENPSSGEKTRILAAVLHREGTAWFFKMTGDDALVGQQKPAFIEFLKSISFQAPVAQVAQSELPPNHPPIDSVAPVAPAAAASAGSEQGRPVWQVPGAWQETSGGGFLVAKFLVSGADNVQAAVNVSMSAGEGGGLAGNVNRWRGQLGLGQLSEEEISKLVTPVDTAGGKAMLVDMTGTDPRSNQKARLVGAIVPQADRTWFYKLMGNEQLVAQQKDAFTKFVQTAKYP
jgi:hypothetical protein